MVMVFSMASIGVEAAYNAYKDGAITRYDSIDRPVLTTAQYASMAMDEIDRMLGEANIKIEYDVAGMLSINADFTSVDKALKSVADLYGSVKSMLSTIGGDVQNLKFGALVNESNNTPKILRDTSGKTDADIFLALLQFLKDNSEIIAKVPKGSAANGGLDLGILSGFVDLGDKLNVPKLVKELIAGLVWPDTPKANLNTNMTLDQYLSTFIEEVASGAYAQYKDGISGIKTVSKLINQYLPGITQEMDFLHDSVYDLINKGAKIALNNVAVKYANNHILSLLGRLCGYDYTKSKDADGDTIYVRTEPEKRVDEPNAMINVINWNEDPATGKITGAHLDNFPVESWGNDWIFDHLNDILGQIVRTVLRPEVTVNWDTSRGNAALKDNIIAVAKTILKETGDALFASYIEVLTPEQIDNMEDDAFLAYVLRSILNASISFVYIENDCDTVLEVLFELVKQLAADFVPKQDYSDLDPDLDSIIAMGLDMAAYGLNGITNMDLEYGLDVDEFADTCVEWLEDNYGGFLDEIEGNSGWEKLSFVLFNLIPANWLSTKEDGSERDDVYDLLMTDIVENILNFDLDEVLKLLDQNEDGELNNTLIEVILGRLTGIVNFILPDVFPDRDYNNLEMLLDTSLLSDIIKNLLDSLYDRASGNLMDALLPVACMVLDLSDPESFGYPYISLEDQHTVGQSLLTSFYMYNGSSGLNTNATDKYGAKTQDALYKYYIRSVRTNNPAVSVQPSSNIYINGGTSTTFTLSNVSSALNTVLKVTITYDVYSEKGTKMTDNPLTATTYTYIYDSQNVTEDDERAKADQSNANMHLIYYKPTTYLSTNSTLGDLADYTVDLQRNKSSDSSTHQNNATFSADTITIDPKLAAKGVSANLPFSVATTKDPSSKEYSPYVVSDKEAKIPAGSYTNLLQFKATPSHSAAETINFAHNIFVYDDFGLGSLLSSAVNSDRQEANYSKSGGFSAKYIKFDMRNEKLPEAPAKEYDEEGNETQASINAYNAYLASLEPYYEEVSGINGAAAWNRYVAAVDAAAAIMYAPRLMSTMQANVDNGSFEMAAMELYEATRQLEACSVSGGTANIRSAVEAIVAPDTHMVNGEEVEYEYDEAGYPYFGRADYVNYTYGNFKSEKRTADRILDDEDTAIRKGEDYQIEAIRAAYVAHRVSLYGERLIRVRAYKTYLNEAIDRYTDTFNAGQQNYSNKSWQAFTRAYNFATAVAAEEIGATIGSTENLANGGLRQSKVNEARAQLVKAAKKLEAAKPLVDYTQINDMIAEAADTYTAGNAEGTYTELSWNTFSSAYKAAMKIVADELEQSAANQNRVDAAYTALRNAFDDLEKVVAGGSWGFTPDEDIGFNAFVLNTLYSELDYVTGLSLDYPNVSDYLTYDGAYTVEVVLNEQDLESTGAIIQVYNGDVLEAEYQIVLYGDVNGDGIVDGMDRGEMFAAMGTAGLTTWEDFAITDENPYAWAADLNHDAVLDAMDAPISVQIEGFVIAYNQGWTTEEDPIYFE
jgi:hypothetical protein